MCSELWPQQRVEKEEISNKGVPINDQPGYQTCSFFLPRPWARPTGVGLNRLGGFDSRPTHVTIEDRDATILIYQAIRVTYTNQSKRLSIHLEGQL